MKLFKKFLKQTNLVTTVNEMMDNNAGEVQVPSQVL